MAYNIYTKPITKTNTTASTTVYTQEVKLDEGEYQTISFPQCLDNIPEEIKKEIIHQIMIKSLQQSE